MLVRPQTVSVGDAAALAPEAVRQWLLDLPRANIGQMTKAVYERLANSNRYRLSPKVRLGFLEVMTPEIERLLESLEQRFRNATFSFTEKQRKIIALVRAILKEQAIAYKSVVHQDWLTSDGRNERSMLARTLVLAVYYQARQINHYFRCYTEIPPTLWKELYLLFELARRNELDNVTVPLPKPSVQASVRTLFKSCLLIALANPNQLRVQEFWTLQFNHLELARKLRLVSPHLDEAQFVVQLRSDSGPIQKALCPDYHAKGLIGIDTQALVFYLQQLMSGETSSSAELNKMLMHHLVAALGHLSTRSFARVPCHQKGKLAMGLAATSSQLEQYALHMEDDVAATDALSALEGSLRDAKILDDDDTYRATHQEEDDPWEKLYRPKVSVNDDPELQKKYHLSGELVKKPVSKLYQMKAVTITDSSPSGYGIHFDEEAPPQTQTDEVVGLFEMDSDNPSHGKWSIGIIRWIRWKDTKLCAGIQSLSTSAEPITLKLKQKRKEPVAEHRALLLPEMPHVGQPPTVLTPALPYKEGDTVHAQTQTESFTIKLEARVAQGRGYQRFEYRRLESPSQSVRKERLVDEDLDDVWQLL